MLDERARNTATTTDTDRESDAWASAYKEALATLGDRVGFRILETNRRDTAMAMADHDIPGMTPALRHLLDLGLTVLALADTNTDDDDDVAHWSTFPSLRAEHPEHPTVRCPECDTENDRVIRLVTSRGPNGSPVTPNELSGEQLQCARCGCRDVFEAFRVHLPR